MITELPKVHYPKRIFFTKSTRVTSDGLQNEPDLCNLPKCEEGGGKSQMGLPKMNRYGEKECLTMQETLAESKQAERRHEHPNTNRSPSGFCSLLAQNP